MHIAHIEYYLLLKDHTYCTMHINPLTSDIGQNCPSKVWRLITNVKKIVKISYSTEIVRATIFNFIGTPLKSIISTLLAKNRTHTERLGNAGPAVLTHKKGAYSMCIYCQVAAYGMSRPSTCISSPMTLVSHDQLHHHEALSRDCIQAERGGDQQASSAERCARSVYSCLMPWIDSKYTWNTHLFSA